MGQRFQIVIKTPAEKYKGDNPNNIEGNVFVYHCQWLLGYFAIWRGGELIYAIKELIKHQQERRAESDGFLKNCPIHYDRDVIEPALKWVCHHNLTNQNSISPYFDAAEYKLKDGEDWKSLFNSFDNNNGILFLEVTQKGEIRYCFYNPMKYNEASEENQEKLLNREEYLKDYFDDNFEKDEDYEKAVEQFKQSKLLKSFPKIEKWMKEGDKK